MNRIYRSILNHQTGTFVAAPENAKSGGKASSTGANAGASARFVLKALAVSLTLAFSSNVYALPTDGAVSAGSASIAGGAGTTTITQTSQNVAINWQSFSIGQGEAVQFVQPNSSSIALNRVLGSDPSSILGSLSANGKVFLLNGNGILFGKGAQVNVGGLVASTLNLTDSDFMAGKYKFAGASPGTVLNQGSINADGGYVALLGANVSNEGVISARLGTVALAAGDAITLDVAGDGLLNVTVDQSAVNALVQNSGLIQADGGQVLLTAQAAGDLLQGVVNNTGVIRAQTIENHKGTIRLLGNMQSGTVNVGGTLDVSGMGAGQTGGSVTATGHHVGIFSGHIDASGDVGGGTVLIGGGYQGKNPDVQNASATYMSVDSTINADAITNGNGGTVVLWADDSTRAYGSITARGGAQGGDGGLIETSAHWLDVWGIKINASAPNGKAGTWLLDPADITIGTPTAGMPNAPVGGVFAPFTGLGAASLSIADLVNALQLGGGTNVTITTTNTGVAGTPSGIPPSSGLGDITLAAALTWDSPANPATLTLNAGGDVNINAAITANSGNLVVCCGRDINVRAAITTSGGGGSVLLSAGRDVTLFATGAITTTVGNVTICAGHDINVIGKIMMTSAGTGALAGGLAGGLVLSAGNAATGPGAAGGTVNILAVGAGRPELTRASATPMDVSITYNPTSYTTPTDYSSQLILNTPTITLTQFMLVFPGVVDKTADGTTGATLAGFRSTAISGPVPGDVTLVPGPLALANFDTPAPGTDKIVTFSGFGLTQNAIVTGGTSSNFALPVACCAPAVQRTTGNITPAASAPITPIPSDIVQTVPVLPTFTPLPVLAATNLGVEGIRMPPIEVVSAPPVESAPIIELTPEVVAPPVAPPPVYVPPKRPRKADRS